MALTISVMLHYIVTRACSNFLSCCSAFPLSASGYFHSPINQLSCVYPASGDELDRLVQWHELAKLTDTLLSLHDIQVPCHLPPTSVDDWTAVAEEGGTVLAMPSDPDMELFDLLHRRFGHAGYQTICNMVSQGMVEGLGLTPRQLKSMASYRMHAAGCVACRLAKFHASSHKTSMHQVARPLQEVHMDVAGPHMILGRMKEMYYLLLVCVHSNAVWVVCFKTRDDFACRSSSCAFHFCRTCLCSCSHADAAILMLMWHSFILI